MFDYDIGPAVMKACKADCYSDALCLSRAAQIVRRDMFQSVPPFDGFFSDSCQSDAVPKSLLALVNMILEGPSISQESNLKDVPAALQVSQLLVYNSVKLARPALTSAVKPKEVRHSRQKETALPLYAGLFLYARMRKKSGLGQTVTAGSFCIL